MKPIHVTSLFAAFLSGCGASSNTSVASAVDGGIGDTYAGQPDTSEDAYIRPVDSRPDASGSEVPDAGQSLDSSKAEAASEASPPPLAECNGALEPSGCNQEGSWVRGVARFDPGHFKSGARPILRVILRHAFTLLKGEEKIGGRLHAYTSFPVTDVSSGKIAFSLDMCMFGTAMWSEENGPFHLVAILDENDNNDLDRASTNPEANTMSTPDVGELVKMVDVRVSCHAPSPCVDITLDCKEGAACTTIAPIKSCAQEAPGCKSDDAFCK